MSSHLSLFEHDGGLAMSDAASGTQWDLPFGWAPTNWLATKGLAQYGFTGDASRIAKEFSQTVRQNFLHDGTIREKYNVVNGSANIEVAAGYKSNVVGFGWTNGVYLEMNDLLNRAQKDAAILPAIPTKEHTERSYTSEIRCSRIAKRTRSEFVFRPKSSMMRYL